MCQILWAQVHVLKTCTSLKLACLLDIWYSVKIRVNFGVRSKDEKLIKKANLHENSILESFGK